MHTFQLQPHPSTPCSWIDSLSVTVSRDARSRTTCRYEVHGEIDRLLIPLKSSAPKHTDGLWKHTCFEFFLRSAGTQYAEFNFSPSGDWAAYRFDGYRSGMADLALNPPPAIAAESTPRLLVLTAAFDRELGWKTDRMALSAVIEDRDGKIAYWALRHAEGKADFHHEAGFVSIEPRGRGSGFD